MPERVIPVVEPAMAAEAPTRGAAVGCSALAVPATVVGNAPIAERLGVDERWIETRTGIKERRVLRGDERISDLAAQAAAVALERAGLDAGELDLLLVATTSQDEVTPNTAPLVAGLLGASSAAAMDVGAACTAFVAAIQVAAGQLESGRARNALVIGADALTQFLDPTDRRTAALFGDGAGAVVMAAAPEGRVGPVVLRSDPALEMIHIRRGGTLYMQGHDTFVNAVARMSDVTLEVLARADLTLDEVDLFVYHQANARILSAVGQRLGLAEQRVLNCIDRYGNTSAASIPIALAEAEAAGLLGAGMRVLMGAFGAGFTWGAALVEWGLDAA